MTSLVRKGKYLHDNNTTPKNKILSNDSGIYILLHIYSAENMNQRSYICTNYLNMFIGRQRIMGEVRSFYEFLMGKCFLLATKKIFYFNNYSQQTKMSVIKSARPIVLCLTIALWLTLYILYIIPVNKMPNSLLTRA